VPCIVWRGHTAQLAPKLPVVISHCYYRLAALPSTRSDATATTPAPTLRSPASFHTQVPPLMDVLAAPWCRVLHADVRGLLRIVVWPLQVRIGACCSTRPAAIGRRRRPRGLTRAGWLWHRVLFPKLEELAQQGEYTSVKFIKIDVDELEVRAERPPPAPPLALPSPNCLRACRLAVPTQNTRQDLAEELDVSSLPTIGLFRNGAEIDRSIGSNIDGVVEMLAKAGAASSKASSSPRASL
jgi:hypothetical protein